MIASTMLKLDDVGISAKDPEAAARLAYSLDPNGDLFEICA
jgi:hypothetical protein